MMIKKIARVILKDELESLGESNTVLREVLEERGEKICELSRTIDMLKAKVRSKQELIENVKRSWVRKHEYRDSL